MAMSRALAVEFGDIVGLEALVLLVVRDAPPGRAGVVRAAGLAANRVSVRGIGEVQFRDGLEVALESTLEESGGAG